MSVTQPLLRWMSVATLSAGVVCLPTLAAQAAELSPGGSASNKAQVEHSEALAQPTPANKAQIERGERLQVEGAEANVPEPAAGASSASVSGAAAWQLALSALGGAVVAGGVVVGAQQMSRRHHHDGSVVA